MKHFASSGRNIPIDITDPSLNFKFNLANRDVKYQMTELHGLELYEKQPEIIDRIWRGARELIMIHREYGKSTMAEDVVINDLIFEKNAFIMYFSATMDSAQDHTRAIMNFFNQDKLPDGKPNPLKQLVPERNVSKSYKWRESDFVLTNGNRCKAAGLDKFVLGKREMDMRPTRIIIDDPVKKETGFDEDTIETFYKTILPMGGPMTRITVIGTPRRYSDIIMELKNDYEQSFNVHFYPAIFDNGKAMSNEFWMRKGACCYDNRYICGTLDGEALVLQHIEQKKREVKSLAWATEYLLQPVDDESSLFPMTLLEDITNSSWSFKASRIKFQRLANGHNLETRPLTVIGCDHAFTTSDSSDYSVFTVLQIEDRHFRILDIWRGKLNFEGQKQKLIDMCRIYKPSLVYSEKNQSQVVFSEDIALYQSHIPIKPFLTHANKNALTVGVPSMVTYFENKIFDIPYGDEQTRQLVDNLYRELNAMTIKNGKVKSATKNDDMVMSLWIALQAAVDVSYSNVQSAGGISMATLQDPEYYEAKSSSESEVLHINPFAGQRGAYN